MIQVSSSGHSECKICQRAVDCCYTVQACRCRHEDDLLPWLVDSTECHMRAASLLGLQCLAHLQLQTMQSIPQSRRLLHWWHHAALQPLLLGGLRLLQTAPYCAGMPEVCIQTQPPSHVQRTMSARQGST